MRIYLSKSTKDSKKYMVKVKNSQTGNYNTVHFGAEGMSDYTKHKDIVRKKRYITRHKNRENWKKSGIDTAGFWSRWLLWGEPTLKDSISDIERRFNVKIVRVTQKRFAQLK